MIAQLALTLLLFCRCRANLRFKRLYLPFIVWSVIYVLARDLKLPIYEGPAEETKPAELARGARKVLNADIAVSVSGIAGPGGAMPGKPVGTTWIGLVTNEGEWAKLFQFSGNRVQNKSQAAEAALQLLFDLLQGRGLEE